MSQPDNQKTMFTDGAPGILDEEIPPRRPPVAIQEVVDRDTIKVLYLLIYQVLDGFVSASDASPIGATNILL